jgi:hypothetical protein
MVVIVDKLGLGFPTRGAALLTIPTSHSLFHWMSFNPLPTVFDNQANVQMFDLLNISRGELTKLDALLTNY